jgi:hypothetical protein
MNSNKTDNTWESGRDDGLAAPWPIKIHFDFTPHVPFSPGCIFDGLETGSWYWLSCSCRRCTPWC